MRRAYEIAAAIAAWALIVLGCLFALAERNPPAVAAMPITGALILIALELRRRG